MKKKFKVELEIEVDTATRKYKAISGGRFAIDYIIAELQWANQSFEVLKVTKIKEVKC